MHGNMIGEKLICLNFNLSMCQKIALKELWSAMRTKTHLTERLRNEVLMCGVTNSSDTEKRDTYPCPPSIKPFLHFYKYLQPVGLRKLHLNLPLTLICSKRDNTEDILLLSMNEDGMVVKRENPVDWRKALFDSLREEAGPKAEIIAVRNVAHWKGGIKNKSAVIHRESFEQIINAPTELAFSIQQYVRCRGTNSSIYRISWSKQESKCFAVNICNSVKYADIYSPEIKEKLDKFDDSEDFSPHEAALAKATILTPFYCVTSTSDVKNLKLPKIRGHSIFNGLQAINSITEHVQLQLPGIKFESMVADFIRDEHGKWWFIRVVSFEAFYKVQIPSEILQLPDSPIEIPAIMRSKYFRQSRAHYSKEIYDSNSSSLCSLCGCSCDLPDVVISKLKDIFDSNSDSPKFLESLSQYRMTLKMAIDTIYMLRQRGITLASWENSVIFMKKTSMEFGVCLICYRVYYQQQKLAAVSWDLHRALTSCIISSDGSEKEAESAMKNDKTHSSCFLLMENSQAVLEGIEEFHTEIQRVMHTSTDNLPGQSLYRSIMGYEVDPTSSQLRIIFFFHELQHAGLELKPTDFYLEYQFGQVFNRLEFEGSKLHTPNRWQLCQARVHYAFAPAPAFLQYSLDKNILIKLKTAEGDSFQGYTLLPLRKLILSARRPGGLLQAQTRSDYLLEVQTVSYGILTLKATLGLIVDDVPFSHVRDSVRDGVFLQECQSHIYWPPFRFHLRDALIPDNWMENLIPLEYVSSLPISTRSMATAVKEKVKYAAQVLQQQRGCLENAHVITNPVSCFSAGSESGLKKYGAKGSKIERKTQELTVSLKQPIAQTTLEARSKKLVLYVRKLIVRVAGEVVNFPTQVTIQILRHATYQISDTYLETGWNVQLAKITVDILADMEGVTFQSLALLGELLSVLLRSNLAPTVFQCSKLHELISPYWLQRQDGVFEYMERNPEVSSSRRMIWNRAVRRCESCHHNLGFRARAPSTRDIVNISSRLSVYKELMRQFMGFRVKTQTLFFCEIFEKLEASDTGYIDVAELRSLHNYLREGKSSCITEMSLVLRQNVDAFVNLGERDKTSGENIMSHNELISLNAALSIQAELVYHKILNILVHSFALTKELDRFDVSGCGEISFEDFWKIAEIALGNAIAVAAMKGEAFQDHICIRHGFTDCYDLDSICVFCEAQYAPNVGVKDSNGIIREYSSEDGSENDKIKENELEAFQDLQDGPHIAHSSNKWKGEFNHRGSKLLCSGSKTERKNSSCRLTKAHTSPDSSLFKSKELDPMLEKLGAAEWHITHRQGSLDGTAMENAIKFSPNKHYERPNTRGISAFPNDICSFRSEDIHEYLPQPGKSNIAPNRSFSKEKSKLKKSMHTLKTNQIADRLPMNATLSKLLEEELKQNMRAFRTDDLVQKVARAEAKKKKLDADLIQELERVKLQLREHNSVTF